MLDDAEEEPEFPWSVPGSGARPGRGAPGAPPASEGVRIIGADEAAAAIEAGQVANRRPGDAPRFGDVPQPPPGPRPSLRFPGADPTAVAKPPVVPAVARRPMTAPPEEPLLKGSSWDDIVDNRRETQPPPSQPETAPQYAPRYVAADHPGDGGAGEMPASTPSGPGTGATELPHWTEPPTGEHARLRGDDLSEESDDDLMAWSTLSAGPRWRDQPTDWDDADFGESVLDDPARSGALRAVHPDDEDQFLAPPTLADTQMSQIDDDPDVALPPFGRASGRVRRRPVAGDNGGPLPGGPPSAPRDVPTAVITGVVALAVVLVAALIGPGALAFLVGVGLVLAAAELYQGMRTNGYHPATLLGLAATASIVAAVYWRGEEAYPLVLALFFIFSLLWYLTGVVRARPTMNVGATALGFLYVGFLGSFAALILGVAGDNGIGILLGAILATSAYDIGAFFVGRWAGKTPLAPELSPNKTIEGLVGGTFATLIVSLVVVRGIHPWNAGRAFWLAVIVAVAAPLGDLCESMIKRDLGVKDMGTLLPGHGGVFDRIDALLFVMPATYYLLRVLA
ncbi:MAG TPA: phosphatidate cytidylyltransferase [Acidimicrobiales bacterium]|nr:phosphatidate cytidylyltransferase [Acidimicrobiales bacterium]